MATRQERETPKKNNSLRDFQGINTRAARQVIGDDQFAWLENVQPIGFGNLQAVPGPSGVLATWVGTAYQMIAVNINSTDYQMVFCTNGALYAVNLATYVVTTVATVGTLSNSGASCAQWENSQIIIVDPTNGYFTWNSTTLTKWNGTIQLITVTQPGTGFTSVPTFGSTGGGGTSFTWTAALECVQATITAAGTGYSVGNVLYISGGTATVPATVTVASINTGTGAITGINLTALGTYTVPPTNPASVTGGGGSGATFTLSFGIGPGTVTNAGSGYTTSPTLTVTGGGGSGFLGTGNISVVPSGGTAVATYAGYVWVASNRTIVFSAPNSYNDFTPANGGGSFVVVDEVLHSKITSLVAANNFLYFSGSSSFNVISDVSVVTTGNGTVTTPTTVFSNTNISASIGTTQVNSIVPYYRALWFATPYGFYALYGSTTQKASEDLDGIFPLITNAISISAGTAVINEILCLCFMFQYADPINGTRTIMAVFFDKKWFICSQYSNLTLISSAVINGTATLYSTDGTHLYSLFTNVNTAVNQTIQTKLWDMGDPLTDKQSIKFGLEAVNPSSAQGIYGTIDTELSIGQIPISLLDENFVSWVNTSGNYVQWTNSSNQTVQWLSSGYAFMSMDVQTNGRYLGVTLYNDSIGVIFEGLHLQYELRAKWSEGGPY